MAEQISIIGLIWGVIIFILWLLAVYSCIAQMVYAVKLRSRVKKLKPSIIFYYFIFFDKMGWQRYWKKFPAQFFQFFKMLFSFGSKAVFEEYLDNFIEVEKIKKLHDKEADKYLAKVVSSGSLFIRVWIIAFLIMPIINFFLFVFGQG